MKTRNLPGYDKPLDKMTLGEIMNLEETKGIKVNPGDAAKITIITIDVRQNSVEKWEKSMKDINKKVLR